MRPGNPLQHDLNVSSYFHNVPAALFQRASACFDHKNTSVKAHGGKMPSSDLHFLKIRDDDIGRKRGSNGIIPCDIEQNAFILRDDPYLIGPNSHGTLTDVEYKTGTPRENKQPKKVARV